MHRDRQADRSDDSAECAGKGGQGHKMTFSIFDFGFSIRGEDV